jgi:hypothetical protein
VAGMEYYHRSGRERQLNVIIKTEKATNDAAEKQAIESFTNLYPLDFKFNIPVFDTPIEFGISVDVVDSGHVMCDQRQYLFTSFFRIVVDL